MPWKDSYVRAGLLGDVQGFVLAGFGSGKAKKKLLERSFRIYLEGLFFSLIHVVFVAAHEFVYTACGIHQLHFAGVERM